MEQARSRATRWTRRRPASPREIVASREKEREQLLLQNFPNNMNMNMNPMDRLVNETNSRRR